MLYGGPSLTCLFSNKNQALLSSKLAERLHVTTNDIVTFIGSTMDGAFSTYNFVVSGIFDLNIGPIDKDMMIVDIKGAEFALDMDNAASEILGYKQDLFRKKILTFQIFCLEKDFFLH